MNTPLTSTRPKPLLNEEAFQQLLEAAYVIQQQNDRFPKAAEKVSPNRVLSGIIETQRAIHAGHLNLSQAMELIVERLRELTSASWAAVGIVAHEELQYRAISSQPGAAVEPSSIDSCLSSSCLRTGEVLRYAQMPSNGSSRGHATGIRSLIAVPVYSEGAVAGVLELGFSQANAFDEREVSTCQLMAGLITEAMSRAAESEWKQTLAAERATMLETLERIKPQLERLVEPVVPQVEAIAQPEPTQSASSLVQEGVKDEGGLEDIPTIELPQAEAIVCRGCGNQIAEEEAFCGLCGLPSPNQKPTGDIQSKWASLWHMQQAAQKKGVAAAEEAESEALPGELLAMLNRNETPAIAVPEPEPTGELETVSALRILPHEDVSANASASTWSSALKARTWLESLNTRGGRTDWLAAQWRRHRANIYLGVSILLLLAVVAGWNSGPPGPAATPGRPRLSLMEKTLVALNLAEPPPTPVYMGNPQAQVWVDLHTALYYCSGEDLYGKTPDGKMTTQHDAQQDSFQPALRKACN